MDKLLFKPGLYQRRFSQTSMPEKERDEVFDSDEKDSGACTAYSSEEDCVDGLQNTDERPDYSEHEAFTSSIDLSSSGEIERVSHGYSGPNESFSNGYADPNSDTEEPDYFKRAQTPIDWPKPVVKIYPSVRGLEVLSPEKPNRFNYNMEEEPEECEQKSEAQLEFEKNSGGKSAVGGILKELYERHAKLRSSVGLPEDSLLRKREEDDQEDTAPYLNNLDELASRPADSDKPNPYALLAQYRQRRYSGSDIPTFSGLTPVEFDIDGPSEQTTSSETKREYHPVFSKDDLGRRPNRFGGARLEDLLQKYSHRRPTGTYRSNDNCDIKPILYSGEEENARSGRSNGPWLQTTYKPFITRSINTLESRTQKLPLRHVSRDVRSREITRNVHEKFVLNPPVENDDVFEPVEDRTCPSAHQSGTTTPRLCHVSKILETSPKGEALSLYLASRFAEKEPPPEPRSPSPTTLMHQEAESILDRHRLTPRSLSTASEPHSPIAEAIETNPVLQKYRQLSEGKNTNTPPPVTTGRRKPNLRHDRVDSSNKNGSVSATNNVLSDTESETNSKGGATVANEPNANPYTNSHSSVKYGRSTINDGRFESNIQNHGDSLLDSTGSMNSQNGRFDSISSISSRFDSTSSVSTGFSDVDSETFSLGGTATNKLTKPGETSTNNVNAVSRFVTRTNVTLNTSVGNSDTLRERSESTRSTSDSSGGSYSPAYRPERRLSSFSERFSYFRRSSVTDHDEDERDTESHGSTEIRLDSDRGRSDSVGRHSDSHESSYSTAYRPERKLSSFNERFSNLRRSSATDPSDETKRPVETPEPAGSYSSLDLERTESTENRSNSGRGRSESVRGHSESSDGSSCSPESRPERKLSSFNERFGHLRRSSVTNPTDEKNRPIETPEPAERNSDCSDSGRERSESVGDRSDSSSYSSAYRPEKKLSSFKERFSDLRRLSTTDPEDEKESRSLDSTGNRFDSVRDRSESVGGGSDSSGGSPYSPGYRPERKLSSFKDRFSHYRRSSATDDDDKPSVSRTENIRAQYGVYAYGSTGSDGVNTERRPRASRISSVVDIGDI